MARKPSKKKLPPEGKPERASVLSSIRKLIKRGDHLTAETLAAYERTRREMLGQILAGTETPLTVTRYRLLVDQIDQRLDALTVELRGKYTTAFADTVAKELEATVTELRQAIGTAAVEHLALGPALPGPMVQQVIKEGAALVKAPIEQLKTDIRRELTQSMIRGEGVQPAAKRILALKDETGNRALTLEGLKKPVFRTAEERAEVIARTELSKAANAAHVEQYVRMSGRLKTLALRWSSSMCSRMCTRCTSMNGVKVRPGELFPVGVAAPPLHPRCRCRVVAEVLTKEEFDALPTY